MKKIFKILGIIVTVSFFITSCNDYMDTSPSATYDEATVWGSRLTADAFVYDVYNSILPKYLKPMYTAPWDNSTALGYGAIINGADMRNFNVDLIITETDYGFFGEFKEVRKVNLIIEMSKKYQGQGLTEKDVKELTAEAKLLRALLYFRQARANGRIVFVDKVLSAEDVESGAVLNYKLTETVDQSYDLIIKDLEDAIPDMITAKIKGKLNKYVAEALLSEVCLQAAAYSTDKTRKNNLYNRCVTAGNDVEANYSLTDKFGDMFNENNANADNEIIFASYYKKINTGVNDETFIRYVPFITNDLLKKAGVLEREYFNRSDNFFCWGVYYPTQNLADRFLVIDANSGKAVKWNESSQFTAAVNPVTYSEVPDWAKDEFLPQGVDTGKFISLAGEAKIAGTNISEIMYKNRDARFYETLVYNGCDWYGERVTTHFRGNLNTYSCDNDINRYMTYSNYIYKKGIYNNTTNGLRYESNTDFHRILFRLGRVLLNKAEAQLCLGNLAEAKQEFNKTRTIHGKLPPSEATNLSEAWIDYQRERAIEFPTENDAYWSSLRWGMIGGDANGGLAPKSDPQLIIEEPTSITISNDDSKFFIGKISIHDIHKRNFEEFRRFLLPIPKQALERNPGYGKQNDGW